MEATKELIQEAARKALVLLEEGRIDPTPATFGTCDIKRHAPIIHCCSAGAILAASDISFPLLTLVDVAKVASEFDNNPTVETMRRQLESIAAGEEEYLR